MQSLKDGVVPVPYQQGQAGASSSGPPVRTEAGAEERSTANNDVYDLK